MQSYRVAVVGCGPRGVSQAQAYQGHPRTEVVGLCDLNRERLDQLGDALGCAARFADLDAMIRAVAPDIVAIPTGTEFHHELCLKALGHGCHIDVEKPLCVDLVQADQVVRVARGLGLKIAVHHQTRVGATMRAMQKAIADGAIGQPLYLDASCKGYYGGYGLMNIGTHLVTNVTLLAGRCRSVTASVTSAGHPIEPDDVLPAPNGMGPIAGEKITATLEFDDSVTAVLRQHRFPKVDSTAYGIQVLGTAGRLYWSSRQAWLLPQPHFVPNGTNDQWSPLEPVLPSGWPGGVGNEVDEYWYVDEFVRTLDENRAHPCSGVEALHTIEVLMGIFESGARQCRIELPQADREHPLLRWRREHGLGEPPAAPRDYGAWLRAEDERLAALAPGSRDLYAPAAAS